jgi:myo-inositol-1(or 4)-monophosphatase
MSVPAGAEEAAPSREEDLRRIEAGLREAAAAIADITPGAVDVELKAGGDPVTEADHRIDGILRRRLPRDGEGWLSEETVDDPARLDCRRVWIVDPVDGTREFVEGLPEWCISIGLVENGLAVAGGIFNPVAGNLMLGSLETGVTLNGEPARVSERQSLEGARVLASRSETRRGEWQRFAETGFMIEASGSVAYKLALVAVGLADATWTLVAKNEWDVAAGAALVAAAGGEVLTLEAEPPRFNRRKTLFRGFVATPPGLRAPILSLLDLP